MASGLIRALSPPLGYKERASRELARQACFLHARLCSMQDSIDAVCCQLWQTFAVRQMLTIVLILPTTAH